MTSELIERARQCDRECDAARTPEEMRRAISRRKLVRAEMEFQRAIDAYDAANPIGPIADSFPFVS
jgi:hypothetical protein